MAHYEIEWYIMSSTGSEQEWCYVEAEDEFEALQVWQCEVGDWTKTVGSPEIVLFKEPEILSKGIYIDMPDNCTYRIPVKLISMNRASYYALKDGVSIRKSLLEDTTPFFTQDEYEIIDYAKNNMDWRDVMREAKVVRSWSSLDNKQTAWLDNDMEIK